MGRMGTWGTPASLLLSLLLACLPGRPAAATGPEVVTTLEARARGEAVDGPSPDAALDEAFEFHHARLRFGLGLKWPRLTLRGVLQGAFTGGLPEAGAFGIAPVYTAANGGDTDPSHAGIAELAATFHGDGFEIVAGRQGWADGLETTTGVAHLDAVKKRRLAERLVGNWDWVNVGRRFDGVTFRAGNGGTRLAGLALIPLAGGVNYEEAFTQLDDLAIYGLTLTGTYGAWLPNSELRLFALRYDDERRGARAATGGAVEIDTWGVSLLAGDERGDVLAWVALQRGDWGAADHDALAFIVEGGRKVRAAGPALTLRGGIAQASGDGAAGGDHESFFNLLPTNHKFYGSMDFNAFSNLRDLYAEALLAGEGWSLRLALHDFELVEAGDAWYGGSGAFDEARLGFAARRPAAGRFASRDLGREVDAELGLSLPRNIELRLGLGWFEAGDGGEEILAADGGGTWAFAQLAWSR